MVDSSELSSFKEPIVPTLDITDARGVSEPMWSDFDL